MKMRRARFFASLRMTARKRFSAACEAAAFRPPPKLSQRGERFRLGFAWRVGESGIHLRPARGDAVEFPLTRLTNDAVRVRRRGVQFAVEDRFLGFSRLRQLLPGEIDDLRAACKADATLFAHAVAGDNVQVVLGGAYRRRMLAGIGAERPIRGDDENL